MVTLVNRAKMSTSTTGTGTITLGSAETGYQSFADAGVSNGDVVRYVIEDGDNWEIGSGTYTSSGTTLSRTVDESSNSDAALNLTGSAVVFITAAAEDILSDIVDDTTPQLGGNLDVQAREITTSTTNGNVKLTPNGTGVVEVKGAGGNDGTLQLNCSDNSHGVKIKSPPHSAAASYTLTLPDDDGDASEFLQTDGSGNLSWAAAGGGGADLYAANESSPTAQPSATGANAIAIGDSATASAQDAISVGDGATNAGISAVALGTSYASGADSFAAAIANNTSTYGATGANSIAMGYQAKATGDDSIAIGESSNSSGTFRPLAVGYNAGATQSYSTAIGSNASATASNAMALGSSAEASGSYSIAIGFANADASFSVAIGRDADTSGIKGKYAFACSDFSAAGDAQTGTYVLRSDTTDATAEALTTNKTTASTDNQIILPNNSAHAFHGTIVARQQAAGGTASAAWKVEGLIRREGSAGTTVLVNSATTVLDNTPSWGMALSADTTNGGLKIEVTGAASTNIRWVATIHTSEVIYA